MGFKSKKLGATFRRREATKTSSSVLLSPPKQRENFKSSNTSLLAVKTYYIWAAPQSILNFRKEAFGM